MPLPLQFGTADDYESPGLDELRPDLYTTDPDLTAENQRLVRRVHGPKVEVWLRGISYYPWLLGEAPFSRLMFREAELHRFGSPYDLVRNAMGPAGGEFTFVVYGEHKAQRYESEGYVSLDNPVATYPVWRATGDPKALLRLCERYAEHGWDRIGIDKIPARRSGQVNRRPQIMEWLYRVNNAYPHVKFHWKYAQGFQYSFGTTFFSVDASALIPPPMHNSVFLPNGRTVNYLAIRPHLKWVHVLGFSASDLADYAERVRFNLASILWAAENWNNPHGLDSTLRRGRDDPLRLLDIPRSPRHRSRRVVSLQTAKPRMNPDRFPQSSPHPDEPIVYVQPITERPYVPIPLDQAERDKIMCDTCSLARTCRVYRQGSLCGKEESPMSEIVAAVGSRNADVVRGVLARIVDAQVSRYQRSARAFEADGESDILDLKRSKRLSEMESSAIRSTETLLKIVDPEYRDSTIPAIKVGSTVNVFNPRVLVADVMRAMEAEGFDRSQVDPKMVMQAIESHGVVEAEIVDES